MPRYDAKRIEPKWQAYWDEHQTFATGPFDPAKEKMYVLDMFPYPSGAGLHVGHPEGYTATDITCRYARMRGKQVLHPMGFDSFGLPAEEYAIKTGTHPAITTAKNIETFRRQLKELGFSYDWNRELATTDPDYYRWTQWIFLLLFDTWYDAECEWVGADGKKRIGRGRPITELPIPEELLANVRREPDGQSTSGQSSHANQEADASRSPEIRRYQDKHRLAYQHEAPVNWCPALGTVLANEEVIDGKSERGGHPVERLPLRQWMLRITAYADRLEQELDDLNWPESIKLLQRNWIGRSEGAEVDFFVPEQVSDEEQQRSFEYWKWSRAGWGFAKDRDADSDQYEAWNEKHGLGFIRVYTTRPDTLFGVTYMVLSPEHPAVDRLTTPEQRAAVDEYRKQAALKSDLDRTDLAKTKTGVFTGGYAINPVNGEKIPVWIADYVLISYGTGAIMAVPGHDERDFEFAKEYDQRVIPVVRPEDADALLADLFQQRFGYGFYSVIHIGPSSPDASVERLQAMLRGLPEADRLVEVVAANESGTYLLVRRPMEDAVSNRITPPYRQIPLDEAYEEEGTAINSGKYDGLPTLEFKSKITADLAASGLGRKAVNYRLRDWLFSRQRYWGEPFPIWHELDASGQPTGLLRVDAEADLPITLPEMADFKPTGTPEPMLSKAPESWLFKTAADGTRLKRETNTMPQWAGSCWYYLRFVDNKNSAAFIDPQLEKQWLPIDLYVGGAEHAVLHLLYSRFWHKVLFDRGHVHTVEPFQRLVNQGMILGEVEYTGFKLEQIQDGQIDDYAKLEDHLERVSIELADLEKRLAAGASPSEVATLRTKLEADKADIAATLAQVDGLRWVSAKQVSEATDDEGQAIRIDQKTGQPVTPVKLSVDQIEKKGDGFVLKGNPDIAVESRAYKMSKSRGNVINPDKVVDEYGADSLRLYEMFMGPLEQVKPWSMQGVEGVSRFLARVWRTITDEKADDIRLNPNVQDASPSEPQLRLLHKTIKAVTHDIESLGFNTAISRMMEFTNEVSNWNVRPTSILKPFVLLLGPFAPHLGEELWSLLGGTKSLAYEPWPTFDPKLVEDAVIDVPVQINGKLRAKITVAAKADQATVEATARREEIVASQLEGKTVVKVVYVPGRMLNFVVK